MWWPDRRKAAPFVVLAITLVLTGCGFAPLYSGGGALDAGPAGELAAIDVLVISDRSGQQLRNALERRLERAGQVRKRYRLDVTMTESRSDQAFLKGGFGTRASLHIVATSVLTEIPVSDPEDKTGKVKVIWKGGAHARVSWNLLPENYAAVISERDSRARAMDHLAEDISRALAVYFSSGVSAVRDDDP